MKNNRKRKIEKWKREKRERDITVREPRIY